MASSIVALVLGVMSIGADALDTTAPQILENPDRFDTHTVTVKGTVTRLDPRTSRKGNAYYTFRILDLTVFSPGVPPPSCRDGAAVTVEGVFKKVKRVGHHTFRNQIDADAVVCR